MLTQHMHLYRACCWQGVGLLGPRLLQRNRLFDRPFRAGPACLTHSHTPTVHFFFLFCHWLRLILSFIAISKSPSSEVPSMTYPVQSSPTLFVTHFKTTTENQRYIEEKKTLQIKDTTQSKTYNYFQLSLFLLLLLWVSMEIWIVHCCVLYNRCVPVIHNYNYTVYVLYIKKELIIYLVISWLHNKQVISKDQ